MSKKLAMSLQFVTALGAVLGTLIGIAVQELGGNAASVSPEFGMGNTGLGCSNTTLGIVPNLTYLT